MKILMVGTFSGMKRAPNFFASSPSTDWKFKVGFENLGHSVVEINVCGKNAINVKDDIVRHVKVNKFDVAFFGNVFGFLKQYRHVIVKCLDENNVKKVLWHGDVREIPERDVWEAASNMDSFFLTSGAERLMDYKKISRVPIAAWIFNPGINFEIDMPPIFSDILFTGCKGSQGIDGRFDSLRDQILEKLPSYATKKDKVLYMPGLDTDRVYGLDYIRAIKGCVVGVGVNRFTKISRYASERMSDYIANKALILCNRAPGLDKIFEHMKHCIYFDNTVDGFYSQLGLIFEMKGSELDKIRDEGQRFLLDNFSAEKVCQYILDVTFNGTGNTWWEEVYK